ncbi:beta-ketoacyl synthase N-terminal-like domain-containing protein [Crateriforma conspicua]|uniref:beta-ketoacyl synthase N-terminal-like domain-containing protein n=1 Tax=Crateriforma conspicua TaxID=2527996 RepID=UPI00118A9202|nr:beta-ketoacyl synthase N-terminal-like domain-containing protein [Crateriforma conspicua]QDV64958.1 3-oxoacyl-[acyl-carrier-protein] synthase 2 [Crateriforma conspicua]
MPQSDVFITGIGIISPVGLGRSDYWTGLTTGRSGIRSLIEREDDGAKPTPDQAQQPFWIGAPVTGFDAKQYVRPRKALKVMCREIQTAFAASQLAMDDSGWSDRLPADDDGDVASDRVATVFGSEMLYGSPNEMIKAVEDCRDEDGQIREADFGRSAMKGIMPLWMLKYLPNMPACQIGIAINAQGPNNTLVLGDVSGPAAVIESMSCLNRGIADLVICGAAGTRINSTRLLYRHDLPAFAPESAVTFPCDPLQCNAGVIGGEGSVAFTLETADSMAKRDAEPIVRITGIASRFSPADSMKQRDRTSKRCASAGRGSSTAIRNAIDAALSQAGRTESDIGGVVSHAMGDPSMDAAENDALKGHLADCPRIEPMRLIGHTGAASGSFAIATGACWLADAGRGDGFPGSPDGDVLCLAHTSEGSAVASILSRP